MDIISGDKEVGGVGGRVGRVSEQERTANEALLTMGCGGNIHRETEGRATKSRRRKLSTA